MPSRPAAFLDRDGVLNHRIPGDTYVTCPDELVILPHVPEALRRLANAGYTLVVITNQRGVARGMIDPDALDRIHAKLRQTFSEAGVELAGVYHCPHDREEGCGCRKPEPGMILQAAADLDLDLKRSLLVGDSKTDIQAAESAGVAVRVLMDSDGDLREALDQALVPRV